MPRILPPGQACYHNHRPKNPAAYADLVEPASLRVLDAPNLYRDIVRELGEGVGCLGQKAYFESDRLAVQAPVTPKGWGIEKAGLPRIIGTALDVIEDLMSRQRPSAHLDEQDQRRLKKSLKTTRASLGLS